jgi:hypothetical protein
MSMIKFNCDKCNLINLMITIGMIKMNYMINGLLIQQMFLKTRYVMQCVD